METSNDVVKVPNVRAFYPTYEEWKLEISREPTRPFHAPFYPTYEEWKPVKLRSGVE